MPRIIPEAIDHYATEHSAPESPLFQKLVKETYDHVPEPGMQVGRLEGGFLRLLVRLTNAKRVLEIGTFTGYSTLAMAEGLAEGGELIALDCDPVNTKIAQKYWDQHPAGSKIKLKIAPALDSLKALKGPFDLVFIDADKENYTNYWEACLPLVRKGGLLVVDNTLWGARVLNPKESDDKAIVSFNARVAKDPRVEAVLLTVRDGVTVAWKR